MKRFTAAMINKPEHDLTQPGNFLSNFEPLTVAIDARAT